LESVFDLNDGYDNKPYKILDEVYGPDMKPTVGTIIKQLTMAKKAFPGLDLAFLDFVEPMSEDEHPKINEAQTIKVNSETNVHKILIDLISLLHLPGSYIHTKYDADVTSESEIEINKLHDVVNVQQIDFTFNTNTVRMGSAPNTDPTAGGGVLSLEEVSDPDIDALLKHPIAVTTAASPGTLILFGNMGPTPKFVMGESNISQRTSEFVMSYCTQPPFNMREVVTLDRVQKMWKTIANHYENTQDLVTHGVCVCPYDIHYTSSFVPNDTFNDVKFPLDEEENPEKKAPRLCLSNDDEKGELVTKHNVVKPTYQEVNLGGSMCGNPMSRPLNYVNNQNFVNLFQVLLGYNWSEAIRGSPQTIKDIFVEGTDNYAKYSRLRKVILCWVLIDRVNKEYEGFQTVINWRKLHGRLMKSHGLYAQGLVAPTTVRNLIYQCLLLVQATSNLRLSFLGGQGRHFGVVHSLLGISPNNTLLPLKYAMDPLEQPPPFELTIVGRSNRLVDIVDIGAADDVTGEINCQITKTISSTIQHKDQTVQAIVLTNFMLRWCDHVQEIKTTLLNRIKPLELTHTDIQRQRGWYTKARFETFEAIVPMLAIEFLAKELADNAADVETIQTAVNHQIFRTKRSDDPTVPTLDASWPDKATWIKALLTSEYKNGYVIRRSRIKNEHIHALVFIMSNGFYWMPGINPASSLTQFLQSAGSGNDRSLKDRTPSLTFYYPNPDADQVIRKPDTYQEQFLTLVMAKDAVAVSHSLNFLLSNMQSLDVNDSLTSCI
jgi:hypothetical protein